jgi:capsular exopolysaccharide synthesis family protein
MDFWRIIEILNSRKWLILLSGVVTAALTFGATRLTGTKWAATVRIAAVQNQDPSDPSRPSAADPVDQERITQARANVYEGLLKSKEVLEPALASINEHELTQARLKSISFDVPGGNAYELTVLDSNPGFAEKLANLLAKNLVKETSSIYSKQARDVVDLLKEQLQKSDAEIESLRRQYQSRQKSYDVLGNQTDDASLSLSQFYSLRARRDDLTGKLAEAEARLRGSQQELSRLPKEAPGDAPIGPSPLVAALEQRLAQAESDLTTLQAKYTNEKIEVKQALAARDALKARLAAERRKGPDAPMNRPNPALAPLRQEIAQLTQESQGYRAQISAANSALQKTEASIHRSTDSKDALSKMGTDLAQKMEARASLVARLQSADLALDAARGKNPLAVVSWVSEFNPPINTRSGRTKKLLIMALLCALLGSSGLVIAFDGVDRRIKTVKDANLTLPVSVYAAVPQPLGQVTANVLPRVAELQPLSLHSESYHFLARRLLSNAREKGVRSIMAVTTKVEQGSTSIVVNLGITLAQAGKRVVIVDANVRNPQIHDVFHLPNHFGFTNLLEDFKESSWTSALHLTSVPNLSVIGSGPASGNPWQMVRSRNLRELSDHLLEVADYVLYDTPSAVTFTDALNLAPIVDAALLCVRALEPLSGMEEQLVEWLKEENVTLLGSILTDVPASLLDNYKNYQYYYPRSDRLPSSASSSLASAVSEGSEREPESASWSAGPGLIEAPLLSGFDLIPSEDQGPKT